MKMLCLKRGRETNCLEPAPIHWFADMVLIRECLERVIWLAISQLDEVL